MAEPYTVRTSSVYFIGAYPYFFFWWGIFAIYCIAHQLNKIRVFYIRKERIAGNDGKVVTDLPGVKLFANLDYLVRIPFVTEMIPIKHVIGITIFTIINMIFLFFSPFVMENGATYFVPPIKVMDRRAAFIGMVNWGFVFFLAQRNSILPMMSGLTVEQLIPFHRVIARIGLLEFIPHFVWRMWQGYAKHNIVKDTLFEDLEQTTGTIAMLGFLIMFVTSIEYVRRNYFEVFYYCHVIFMLVGIIFSCIHETTCFAFFIPALGLWFFDRVVRSYQSWCLKTSSVRIDKIVDSSASHDGISRVLFENSGLTRFKPGQYVFVSMVKKGGSKLWKYASWHPYTISEVFRVNSSTTSVDNSVEERIIDSNAATFNGEKISEKKSPANSVLDTDSLSDTSSLRRRANALPGDESATVGSLHIKALGNKTRTLLQQASNDTGDLKVIVDGPYGPDLDYQDFQVAALFATGIGITPAIAIIKDIIDKRSHGVRTMAIEHVYLSWAIRTAEEIPAFRDVFLYWNDRVKSSIQPIFLNVTVYVTRESEGTNVFEGLPGFSIVYGERPKIDIEMDKIKTVNANRRVWAHACGSMLFTRTVVNEAIRHRFHAHNETFEF